MVQVIEETAYLKFIWGDWLGRTLRRLCLGHARQGGMIGACPLVSIRIVARGAVSVVSIMGGCE
jgi:hypothetical protein